MNIEPIYNITQASYTLGVHPNTIRRAIRGGIIDPMKDYEGLRWKYVLSLKDLKVLEDYKGQTNG